MNTTLYKRKLTAGAIQAMRRGGRRASVEDKRRAGRAGWEAMVRSQASKLAVLNEMQYPQQQ